MILDRHIPNKRPDEELVAYLRHHWMYLVSYYFLYTILAAIPVGLYWYLTSTFPTLLYNQFVYAVLFLLGSIYYLYVLLFYYMTYIDYYLDVWIVTNHRVIAIEQNGLFNRSKSEFELNRVQDVTATQKGFLATMLTYGDIEVQTAGERVHFDFELVDNPFDIQNKIQDLVTKCREEDHV